MPSTGSWRKRIATALSDDAALGFDLISHLGYMSAVATSGAARDVVMEHAGRQPFRTAHFFRSVFLLVKRMGLEYARAFQVVARAAPTETLKNLLLRFSGAIAAGGAEQDFIRSELRVELENYSARYERTIESLRKWSDAYASLLVSAALIVVVAMVATMLYSIENLYLMLLAALVVAVVGLGVYVIQRTAPVEPMSTSQGGARERRWARWALVILGPLGLAVAVYLYPGFGLGASLIAIGVSLAPCGLLILADDGRVAKVDEDLPAMVRAVGNLSGSLGVSPGHALDKIDRRSLGNLERPLKRLQTRLAFQLDSEACWERFALETGSELIRRTMRSFLDAVRLGARPEQVGQVCGDFALIVTLLRAKRRLTAATFSYLALALHGAMVALLIFVLEIVLSFNDRVAALVAEVATKLTVPGVTNLIDLPFFAPKDMSALVQMTQAMVLILTLANAIAPKAAMGGHPLRVFAYAAATFTLSGVAFLVIPVLTNALFQI